MISAKWLLKSFALLGLFIVIDHENLVTVQSNTSIVGRRSVTDNKNLFFTKLYNHSYMRIFPQGDNLKRSGIIH